MEAFSFVLSLLCSAWFLYVSYSIRRWCACMCVNAFVDCNRHSHTECLEKQEECSKLSPRG